MGPESAWRAAGELATAPLTLLSAAREVPRLSGALVRLADRDGPLAQLAGLSAGLDQLAGVGEALGRLPTPGGALDRLADVSKPSTGSPASTRP